jgi:hypothetical protein
MAALDTIKLEDVVCAADSQVSNRLGDEVAILELDQGTYFGLNPTGAHIWEQLHQPVSVQALLASVVAEYEVDEQTAREDLLKLLEQLRAAGLIEVRGEPAR